MNIVIWPIFFCLTIDENLFEGSKHNKPKYPNISNSFSLQGTPAVQTLNYNKQIIFQWFMLFNVYLYENKIHNFLRD